VARLYEAGILTAAAGAAGPVATVAAGAAACEIRELSVVNSSNATRAGNIQVGRPAAAGTGTLTGSAVQPLDPSDVTGLAMLVTAFGTAAPTAPAVWQRAWKQATGAPSLGVVMVWEPGELVLAASGQLVVWADAAVACTFSIFVKVFE